MEWIMRRRKFMLILTVINLFICVAGLLEWKSNYKGQEHTNNYI
ncbi:hypothetical protein P4K08_14290 [Bacillus cereus]|nr:hypothetical protein [Bacillus cereus]MEB9646711.1 hypothetical protein [Bacillus cereus]